MTRRHLLGAGAAVAGVIALDHLGVGKVWGEPTANVTSYLPPMDDISGQVTAYRKQSSERKERDIRWDREYQPMAPHYATFWYLWAQNPLTNPKDLIDPNNPAKEWSYWQDRGRTPPYDFDTCYLPDLKHGEFDPRYGLYDSANKHVVRWQLSLIRQSKMDVAFVSWWGKDHRSERIFNYIIKRELKQIDTPYPRLRFALLYEQDIMGHQTQEEIKNSLNYFLEQYGDEPEMLRINGRPVVFVYGLEGNGLEKLKKWLAVCRETNVHLMGQVFEGYRTLPDQPDGWMQYAPANRIDNQGEFSCSISPGFSRRGEPGARLERNLEGFTGAVEQMIDSEATWKLVTTLNELGEGTGIEPALEVALNEEGVIRPTGRRIGQEVEILASRIPVRYSRTQGDADAAIVVGDTP